MSKHYKPSNVRDQVWEWASETDSFQRIAEAALRFLSWEDIKSMLIANDIHVEGVTD